MSGWFKWKRPGSERPPSAPVVEEPEPPRSSFAAKVEKWRAYFRVQQALQPTVAQVEAERERRRRAALEAKEDEIAMHVAYKHYFVEGEPLEGPAMPRGESAPEIAPEGTEAGFTYDIPRVPSGFWRIG
jgi:hypothetical protein